MSQALIYTLLALALLLPLAGAVALRLLAGSLAPRPLALLATLIFGIAIGSVLLLARSNAASLQIGSLTLLLPVPTPRIDLLPLLEPQPALEQPAPPTLVPTATFPPTATAAPTVAATIVATPTATLEPTPPPTPLPEPTAPPPEPTEPLPEPTAAPVAQRTYTVEPGDTLRGIAEQFKISVADLLAANNLSAAAADGIKPGQQLIIP